MCASVCLRECVCVCASVRLRVCVCKCVCVVKEREGVCVPASVSVSVWLPVSACLPACVCLSVCLLVWLWVCLLVCVCVPASVPMAACLHVCLPLGSSADSHTLLKLLWIGLNCHGSGSTVMDRPQVAMATPRTNEHGGGDGVDLWNACQMPSLVQSGVAAMLGVSNAWVQVLAMLFFSLSLLVC